MPPLLHQFPIQRGSHASRADGMCALEHVAWLAGERHSDGPECTSDVIAAFVRSFNDVIPSDAARNYYLRGIIPRLINTRGSRAVEAERQRLVVDYMVRGLLPMRLHAEGRSAEARELAGLKPIESSTGIVLAGLAVRQECGDLAVSWACRMASRSMTPCLWVPTAAKLIEAIGTPEAYEVGLRMLSRMIKAGAAVTAPPPVGRIAPPSV